MRHHLKTLTAVAALMLAPLAAPVAASPIVYESYTPDTSSGFWFGTLQVPGVNNMVVLAQRLVIASDAARVSGAVLLSGSGLATFSMFSSDNGEPGRALGTSSLAVTRGPASLHSFDFTGLALAAGTYWLVASSQSTGLGLPVWPVARYDDGPGGLAWQLNDGPWVHQAANFGYALSDASQAEARALLEPRMPMPTRTSVPEPSSAVLLGASLLGLTALRRRFALA